jgi:hypothetical protein
MEMLVSIILSVLSATGILGIASRAILTKLKRHESRQEAIELGMQALLRDRMLSTYKEYIHQGYAPVCIKDNFDNMYMQYHALGANGVMTGLYKEFMALPTEKPNEEET